MSRGLKQRDRRISVEYPATLIESDGQAIEVTIIDLSSSGFRLRCNAELNPGEEVALEVKKLERMRARIHWTRGDEAGGRFVDSAGAG